MTDFPPLPDRPEGGFKFVLADPAWSFRTFDGREAIPTLGEQPYPPMSLDLMKSIPVVDVVADDCLMIMWVISSHVPQALELGEAWGFTYRSLGPIWAKARSPNQIEMFEDGPICDLGMGYWVRQQAEITFVFGRGSPERLSAGVRQMIYAPRRGHSRKPEEQYRRFEALARGPRLEMFGRQKRDGWVTWGNETGKFATSSGVSPDSPEPYASEIISAPEMRLMSRSDRGEPIADFSVERKACGDRGPVE